MSTTVLFVAVVVFAFVVARTLDRFASSILLLSGAEYVIVGAMLGPFLPTHLLTPADLAALDLFVSTVLGVVGFFVGLRIRHAKVGTESMISGLAATLGVIVVVGLAMTEAVELLEPSQATATPLFAEPFYIGDQVLWLWVTPVAIWVGLTVGAAAGASSTAVVEAATHRFGVSATRSRLLRGMASAAEVLAVFAFGMAMAASRATQSAGELGLTLTEWSLVTISAGACTGLLFIVFIGREHDPMRVNVASIGVIVFAAGVGAALGVSPLLVNLIAGLTVAVAYPNADHLETTLRPLWLPCSVLVLLLAGLTWVPASGWFWAFIPGYAVLRLVTRRAFSRIAVATFVAEKSLSVGIGRGLLAQSVVAAAISLAFAQRYPEMAGVVTTTILGGMLLTDAFAMRSLRRYLADVGEIHPIGEPQQEAGP